MRNATLAVLLLSISVAACASDWPQWFGPNHDGVSDEKLAPWAAGGPKQLWKIPVGDGLGEPVVVGGKVYITAQSAPPKIAAGNARGAAKDGAESVFCYDATTGKQLWAQPIGSTIVFERQGNDGPRSTPAVSDGLVYAVGTYLNIACFDANTGKPVWGHDSEKEFGAAVQLNTRGIKQWGCANSPVVDGNLVFVHCGGKGQALMAFDKKTGTVAWKGQDDELAHTTPTVATILGQRQVIFFTKSGLVSVVPESGKVLWRYTLPWNISTAISPVVAGDVVFCSAGYMVGGGACKITKEGDAFKATEIWRVEGSKGPDNVANHWSTPVYHDGYLYGLFGHAEVKTGPMKCVDLKTGKVQWRKEGFGQGGNLLIDGKILMLGDQGQLVLIEANPKEYKELARATPLSFKCWNAPVVSGGKIYARSNKELVCLDTK